MDLLNPATYRKERASALLSESDFDIPYPNRYKMSVMLKRMNDRKKSVKNNSVMQKEQLSLKPSLTILPPMLKEEPLKVKLVSPPSKRKPIKLKHFERIKPDVVKLGGSETIDQS